MTVRVIWYEFGAIVEGERLGLFRWVFGFEGR